VLQGYIELDFIAHPEVISVVLEHLIQTRVPTTMHEPLIKDLEVMHTGVKAHAVVVEKLE
jgi:hypothetical protein